MADVTANTGQTDSRSIWGSGLLSTLGDLATTGANVYATATGRKNQTPAAAPVATATVTTPAWQKYLPWIAGGAALLIVGLLVFRKH